MMTKERRTTRRYRCGGRVEIPRSYSAVPLFGIVVDVSPAGCGICVPSGVDFDPNDETECEVELRFRSSYLTFLAKGTIRGTHRHLEFGGPVLGVRFTELTARGRRDIAEFIRDQEDELRVSRVGAGRELAYA